MVFISPDHKAGYFGGGGGTLGGRLIYAINYHKPSIGIVIRHCKDPYESISVMKWNVSQGFCSMVVSGSPKRW